MAPPLRSIPIAGAFQNLVHVPAPKPSSPVLAHLSDLDGIPLLIKLALAQTRNDDADAEALKRWLAWVSVEHALPAFAKAFVAEPDCIVLLLHALGLENAVSLELVADPGAATVKTITRLLDGDDVELRRRALALGMVDRVLLRLGELQAEEPRRPQRKAQFQPGVAPSPPPQTQPPPLQLQQPSPSASAEPAEERQRHLWRPGYGTGDASSTRADGKREQLQRQKMDRTASTVRCLCRFLQPINLPADDALWAEVLDCLDASCLLRVFNACFYGVTVKVVVPQALLFHALLDLIIVLASKPALTGLLGDVPGMFKSVRELVEGLAELRDDFEDEDPDDVKVRALPSLVQATLRAMAQLAPAKPEQPALATSSAAAAASTASDEMARYAELMGAELFLDRDMRDPNGSYAGHHFAPLIDDDIKAKVSTTRHRRLHRELKAIKRDLPLHFGSTIVLRVDRTRPFVAQAVIFAPHNTPYDSGAFLFDIFFSAEYPSEPPKVNLQTTGQGRVRFNPNLYQNGKVCLSLLGTWRGGATGTENWDPELSSLYQVLVSIQSAILGSEFPHFNEPSVEALFGTPEGDLQKRIHPNGGYERLRVATIQHAMTGQLLSPPAGFESAIRTHFMLKREHIKRTITAWIEEAKSSDTRGHLAALSDAFFELCVVLDGLGGGLAASPPPMTVAALSSSAFVEAVAQLRKAFPKADEAMLEDCLKATAAEGGEPDLAACLQLLEASQWDGPG